MQGNHGEIKAGLIGLGKMGLIRFKELERCAGVRVVCGADPDEGRYDAFPGVACHKDFQHVIDADVDVIFVATPNRFTPGAICGALDAGKHVFSEKPPGRCYEDVVAIREAEARNPNLKLMFGFNHRYHAGIREAKRIVESQRLGRILWVRGIYGKSGGPGYENEWRSSRALCGGGILLDQGIHMLDLFRFFCGDFVEVKSMCCTAYWDADVEDNAFALLRDTQGRIAQLHSSSTLWKHRFSLDVFMADGYVCVNGILSSTRSYGEEVVLMAQRRFDDGAALGKPREETVYFDKDPSWELEVNDFLTYVRDDLPVATGNSGDALAVMKLVKSIYEDDASFVETGNRLVPAPDAED